MLDDPYAGECRLSRTKPFKNLMSPLSHPIECREVYSFYINKSGSAAFCDNKGTTSKNLVKFLCNILLRFALQCSLLPQSSSSVKRRKLVDGVSINYKARGASRN